MKVINTLNLKKKLYYFVIVLILALSFLKLFDFGYDFTNRKFGKDIDKINNK
jgi:hypothetical protein